MFFSTLRNGNARGRVRWGLAALALVSMAAVFAVSASPPDRLPDTPPSFLGLRADLAAHMAMYAVLGAEWALVLWAFGCLRRHGLAASGGALLIVAGYGLLLEAYQQGVPGRSASWDDVVANAAGAGLGVFVIATAARLRAS